MQPVNKVKKQKNITSSTIRNVSQLERGSSNDNNPSCSNDEKIIDDNNSESIFEKIYTEIINPRMPDTAWALHRQYLPAKTIVASQLGSTAETNTKFSPPFYVKQIVFDRKLNYEVYFMNTRTVLKDKPCVANSMKEFENIVGYIDDIKLCSGGPNVEEYGNIDLECGYKDPTEKWRHNLCSLETFDDHPVCKYCLSLKEILQRHYVQRKKLNTRGLPYSRKEKRKISNRRAKRV